MTVVAALQIATGVPLERVLAFEDEIRGADLVVLPEAVLGGYPGRTPFVEYFHAAVTVPGPEVAELAGLAARTGASLVVGVIERAGSTLYSTVVFLDPALGLVGQHRKLVPTARERLVWGRGDGSMLPVVPTAAGRAGAAICWENHMPLLRAAMYAKGVEIWCAPTADDRDVWQASMRHVADEGRCFVVSACPYEGEGDDPFRGGSVIVGPLGDVLAGPLRGTEGLITAEIDLAEIVAARHSLDVSGHYARPDVFSLTVDERPQDGVTFLK
ncbi:MULTISPECIES: carbon-nitrogen hydrolase family protein [unclassified Amycolatopsis]|uniref:carbon-nitrogen hydrolase family protein n=1 Tax=unclassified Amycolatopsis TaxID=2618356 RepID=UPI0028757C8D|nr:MULTISPECIES: carbon-nitrogen hydrolase family protein [unclassified Amycolatopsis]MDS0137906.1 carbon-nitrogen hydrolase family protein [Amycolatopsis sp. 505]MDS0144181.1 carbon-nitrogen hydrolase family protein [Amycolatopsis sp. CM201R]